MTAYGNVQPFKERKQTAVAMDDPLHFPAAKDGRLGQTAGSLWCQLFRRTVPAELYGPR